MAHPTMLHVRVDANIKAQASEALAAMGLSVSDAVRILLKRLVISDVRLPGRRITCSAKQHPPQGNHCRGRNPGRRARQVWHAATRDSS